jgi:hypothetical protein
MYGSMLEITWRGSKPVKLTDGSERKFIRDGDDVPIPSFFLFFSLSLSLSLYPLYLSIYLSIYLSLSLSLLLLLTLEYTHSDR